MVYGNEKKEAQFQDPIDVKKKWLVPFHPDRWETDNVQANEARERVIALVRIWDNIQKFNADEIIEKPKAVIPSGPLFLE